MQIGDTAIIANFEFIVQPGYIVISPKGDSGFNIIMEPYGDKWIISTELVSNTARDLHRFITVEYESD